MKSICLDSNYIIALSNQRDTLHNRAVSCAPIIEGKQLFLSSLVYSEAMTVLSQQVDRSTAIEVGQTLLSSPNITLIHISYQLFMDSWQVFSKINKKNMSFVDCSILAMMKAHRIKKLLTFDLTDFAPLQKQFGFELVSAS